MESLLEKSFECLREKQCRSYLDRLGLEYPRHLDREFLDRLVRRHLEVIPFENLTQVVCHKTVSMDLEQIYEKIVLGRRGGYCFELNSLFLGLVRGLGYKGYPVACRVLRRPGLRCRPTEPMWSAWGKRSISVMWLRRHRLSERSPDGLQHGDGDGIRQLLFPAGI